MVVEDVWIVKSCQPSIFARPLEQLILICRCSYPLFSSFYPVFIESSGKIFLSASHISSPKKKNLIANIPQRMSHSGHLGIAKGRISIERLSFSFLPTMIAFLVVLSTTNNIIVADAQQDYCRRIPTPSGCANWRQSWPPLGNTPDNYNNPPVWWEEDFFLIADATYSLVSVPGATTERQCLDNALFSYQAAFWTRSGGVRALEDNWLMLVMEPLSNSSMACDFFVLRYESSFTKVLTPTAVPPTPSPPFVNRTTPAPPPDNRTGNTSALASSRRAYFSRRQVPIGATVTPMNNSRLDVHVRLSQSRTANGLRVFFRPVMASSQPGDYNSFPQNLPQSGICTDLTWCNDRGTASDPPNTYSCSCACRTGFSGPHCQHTDIPQFKYRSSLVPLPFDQRWTFDTDSDEPVPVKVFPRYLDGYVNESRGNTVIGTSSAMLFRDNAMFVRDVGATLEQVRWYTDNTSTTFQLPVSPDGADTRGFMFDTPSTLPSVSASGMRAIEYRGTHESAFNLFQYGEDDIGISVWVKVSDRRGSGLVWMQADGYTSTDGSTHPLAEELLRFLEKKRANAWNAATWSTEGLGTTTHVYNALYVQGDGDIISFVYSNPDEHIQTLNWYRPELFDGNWHFLYLQFYMKNGRRYIQLYIDGQTSAFDIGWRACFATSQSYLMRSRERPQVDPLPIQNPLTEYATTGASLIIGYTNQSTMGVWSLLLHRQRKLQQEVIAIGAPGMRAYSYIFVSESQALGGLLIAATIISIGALTYFLYVEIYLAQKPVEEQTTEETAGTMDTMKNAGKKTGVQPPTLRKHMVPFSHPCLRQGACSPSLRLSSLSL